MTTIVYDKGILCTDSLISYEKPTGIRAITIGEKAYTDPKGRFVLACYGTLPWTNHPEVFENFIEEYLSNIGILEFINEEWVRDGTIEHLCDNVFPELMGKYKCPEFEFTGLLMTKRKVYHQQSYLNHLDQNKKISKGRSVDLYIQETAVIGADCQMVELFNAAGYSYHDAFKIVARNGGSTGGPIHTYRQSKLKPLSIRNVKVPNIKRVD